MCPCRIYSRERSLKILPWHPYAPVYISSTSTSLHPSHSIWNTWQDSHLWLITFTTCLQDRSYTWIKVQWWHYGWYQMLLSLIYTECFALVLTLQRIPCYLLPWYIEKTLYWKAPQYNATSLLANIMLLARAQQCTDLLIKNRQSCFIITL